MPTDQRVEQLERISSGLGALDVWTRATPPARRPRFTREELATTAIRIADREGFAALSMRRLAAELGAGTMTLYHYVRTKDELLSLVVDAVMGEVVLGPDAALPADWRAALTMIAERTRAALLRHPWIMELADDPPLGPNSARHFDQSLQAVATLPVGLEERFDIVSAVDEYVFGSCLLARRRATQPDLPDADMVAYVEGLVATGEYPQLAALTREHGLEGAWEQVAARQGDPGTFTRNLQRLLAGIEADLAPSGS